MSLAPCATGVLRIATNVGDRGEPADPSDPGTIGTEKLPLPRENAEKKASEAESELLHWPDDHD